MKFDNYEDATLDLAKFRNLVGVFYPPSNQKIWGLFVGISDTTMSQLIYKGIRGDFPLHTFNSFDLNNIEFWAGFYDDSIVPLTEILQDEFLASLCEPGALNKEVDILEDWSDPIRIPKGLTVKLTLHNDKKILYKIYDLPTKKEVEHSKEGNQDHYFFINYYESVFGIDKMSEAYLSFKLPNNNFTPSSISVEFLDK